MKDLIAKLQLDANCALGAIWMHIDAQSARIAELEAQIAAKADTDIPEALELLAAVFDAWENGDDCYEDPEECAGFLGKAFRLDDDIFNRCVELLNRRNPPRNAASTALQAPVREVPGWQPIETAPNDGTDILICQAWDASGNPMCENSHALFTQRASWWAGENGGNGSWIVYNSMVLDPECFFEPTHWMPVPSISVAAAPVQPDTGKEQA